MTEVAYDEKLLMHFFQDSWHDQKIDVFSQVQECRSNK